MKRLFFDDLTFIIPCRLDSIVRLENVIITANFLETICGIAVCLIAIIVFVKRQKTNLMINSVKIEQETNLKIEKDNKNKLAKAQKSIQAILGK